MQVYPCLSLLVSDFLENQDLASLMMTNHTMCSFLHNSFVRRAQWTLRNEYAVSRKIAAQVRILKISQIGFVSYFHTLFPSLTSLDMRNHMPKYAYSQLPKLLSTLKTLMLPHAFNNESPLVLPCNLTHLEFGDCFDQPLFPGELPPKLGFLKFGLDFHQPLVRGLFPTILDLGADFDYPFCPTCCQPA